jgi:hypothetical protein
MQRLAEVQDVAMSCPLGATAGVGNDWIVQFESETVAADVLVATNTAASSASATQPNRRLI